MRVLQALAFVPGVLAAAIPSVPIDSRSLSDIYAAAQKENGVLRVVHGGDGMNLGPLILGGSFKVTDTLDSAERNQADALFNAFREIPQGEGQPHGRSLQVPRRPNQPSLPAG